MSYKAILFAPDGDYVTDYRGSETVGEVVEKLADQGSRWIFYPITFVIRDDGPTRRTQRIVDACEPFDDLKGRTIGSVQTYLRENEDAILEMFASY